MDKYRIDDVADLTDEIGRWLREVSEAIDDVMEFLSKAGRELEDLRSKVEEPLEGDVMNIYSLVDNAQKKMEEI